MVADLLIGGLIFGYAGWTIYRFVQKSNEGKCAGCSRSKRCKRVAKTSGCEEERL